MAEDQNNSNNAGLAQDAKPTAPKGGGILRVASVRTGRNKAMDRSVSFGNMARNDNAGSGKTFAETQRDARDVHQLSEAVADAGLNAFGAVFVEVWVMSHDGTKLQRPPGGNWMDPSFGLSFPDEESMEAARALDIEAIDCAPGAGLAGTLFEESSSGARRVYWRQIKRSDEPCPIILFQFQRKFILIKTDIFLYSGMV